MDGDLGADGTFQAERLAVARRLLRFNDLIAFPRKNVTVLIGYCDYHPVTKSPKIGCYDYSQMSF